MQIEADQIGNERPPTELLPPGHPATYGEVVRELKKGHLGEYEETASYRIASDGAFVHRHITTAASPSASGSGTTTTPSPVTRSSLAMQARLDGRARLAPGLRRA